VINPETGRNDNKKGQKKMNKKISVWKTTKTGQPISRLEVVQMDDEKETIEDILLEVANFFSFAAYIPNGWESVGGKGGTYRFSREGEEGEEEDIFLSWEEEGDDDDGDDFSGGLYGDHRLRCDDRERFNPNR